MIAFGNDGQESGASFFKPIRKHDNTQPKQTQIVLLYSTLK